MLVILSPLEVVWPVHNITIKYNKSFLRATAYMLLHVYATPIPRVLYQNRYRLLTFFHHLIGPIILAFRHQGSLRKSDGFTPNGGAKYKGVAIFAKYAAISRKGY